MTISRASERHLPPDARRGMWPSPSCRVLRDSSDILADRPLIVAAPPWRAFRAKAKREMRAMAGELVPVIAISLPIVIVYLYLLLTARIAS